MEKHAAQQMAGSMVEHTGYKYKVQTLVGNAGSIHKARLEVFGGIMWVRMEQEHRQVLCEIWTRFRMDLRGSQR